MNDGIADDSNDDWAKSSVSGCDDRQQYRHPMHCCRQTLLETDAAEYWQTAPNKMDCCYVLQRSVLLPRSYCCVLMAAAAVVVVAALVDLSSL